MPVFAHMPDSEYFALPAISRSGLSAFAAGKPLSLGRVGLVGDVVHARVLEGKAAVRERYAFADSDWALNTKEGKASLQAFETLTGKRAVRPAELKDIGAMLTAFGKSDVGKRFMQTHGDSEVVIVDRLEGFETECKCKIDRVSHDDFGVPHCLVDLKTTGYRDQEEFKNAIADYGYAAQAWWYRALYAAATGKWLPFAFACISKRFPYECWIQQVSNEQMAFGGRWCRDVLALYERFGKEALNGTGAR